MRTEIEKDVFGREVKIMIPETEADMETLREMEESGELDTDESFADAPSALPLEEQV